MESPARWRACQQPRACVYTRHKLRLLFLYRFRVLRLHGRGQRGMAVYQYGVPARYHDGVAARYEQNYLQKNA